MIQSGKNLQYPKIRNFGWKTEQKKKEECPMKKQTKRNTINLGIFSYTYTRGRHSF